MTLEELTALLAGVPWFSRCGQFPGAPTALPLAAVAPAAGWDWLPTAGEQPDQVHGGVLIAQAEAGGLGAARRAAEQAAVRTVLVGHRAVSESLPVLVGGPHDYTPAAKAGAQFAARMAAREIVVGRPGFWCRAVRLYAAGYWPCGRMAASGQFVVW